MSHSTRQLRNTACVFGIALSLMWPATALADDITLTRTCPDVLDQTCAVQVAPLPTTSVVATTGPSTTIGPAIEFSLGVTQLADAGAALGVTRPGDGTGSPAQSSGSGLNTFQVSIGQTGSASASSGSAQAGQAGGSSATQGSSADTGGGTGETPPGGGGSGINMITNVASVVQIVQIVAHNNTNTTIAPIQIAQQCQQAAVACSGASLAGK